VVSTAALAGSRMGIVEPMNCDGRKNQTYFSNVEWLQSRFWIISVEANVLWLQRINRKNKATVLTAASM
jgi:hypothetical protein